VSVSREQANARHLARIAERNLRTYQQAVLARERAFTLARLAEGQMARALEGAGWAEAALRKTSERVERSLESSHS
jgi:hypothetical protein